MKMLVFSPKAEADIDSIYDYTEDHWGFEKAESYTFDLRDACRALTEGDRRGKHISGIQPGYLALPCNAHFIIYRETELRVAIIRVLHRRMSLERHL